MCAKARKEEKKALERLERALGFAKDQADVSFAKRMLADLGVGERDERSFKRFDQLTSGELFEEFRRHARARDHAASVEECKRLIGEHRGEEDEDITVYAYWLMGNAYARMESYEDALRAYHQAEKICDSNPTLRKNWLPHIRSMRAEACLLKGDFDSSIRLYQQLIDEQPETWSEFHLSVAMARLRTSAAP